MGKKKKSVPDLAKQNVRGSFLTNWILPTANAHHQFILWLHKWFFITSKITIIFAQGTLIWPYHSALFLIIFLYESCCYIFLGPCAYMHLYMYIPFLFHLANIYFSSQLQKIKRTSLHFYLMSNISLLTPSWT